MAVARVLDRRAAVLRDAPPTRRSDGILDAMAGRRPSRTAAQLLNRLAPVALLYERCWRVRSLSLLAGRPFPVAEELAELSTALAGALRPGALVLDVACSEGLYGRHLAHAGADVALVDHSVAFLRRALARSEREGIGERVDAVRALAAHLPFADGVADAVVIGGSLNEIGDAGAALAEAVRVLRPGGRLFLMSLVPDRTMPGRLVQALTVPAGIRYPSAARTVGLLGPGARLLEERLDGVVLRLTAERTPERGVPAGPFTGSAGSRPAGR